METCKLTIANLPQEFKDMFKENLADIISDSLNQFCPSECSFGHEVDVSRHIGPGDIENWLEKRLARKGQWCPYRPTLFCQEEAGCNGCAIYEQQPKNYATCHKCGRTGPDVAYYHIGGEGYLPFCVDTEVCLGSSGARES